jgi:hypothetical protein
VQTFPTLRRGSLRVWLVLTGVGSEGARDPADFSYFEAWISVGLACPDLNGF